MDFDLESMPQPRGKLLTDAPLAPYTWFRVGGTADALFLPADDADLAAFLKALPEDVPVTVLGVGSNTIVRDGGIEGVVIRLMGAYWGKVKHHDTSVSARAGALDLSVAKAAARAGIGGLSFLSGIPGSIGGAVRTNAGCYGHELSDVVIAVDGIDEFAVFNVVLDAGSHAAPHRIVHLRINPVMLRAHRSEVDQPAGGRVLR